MRPGVDAETVAAARRLESEAIASIYEQFVDSIHRYFNLRLSSPDDAEDLTDQLFLKMIEALPTYRERGVPFAAWLFRIAHNLVVDRYRRRDRGDRAISESHPATGFGSDPHKAALDALSREAIVAALATLTEDQREVIILRLVEGWQVEEVAAMMKRSPGAVHALQYRAVGALRAALGEEVRP